MTPRKINVGDRLLWPIEHNKFVVGRYSTLLLATVTGYTSDGRLIMTWRAWPSAVPYTNTYTYRVLSNGLPDLDFPRMMEVNSDEELLLVRLALDGETTNPSYGK